MTDTQIVKPPVDRFTGILRVLSMWTPGGELNALLDPRFYRAYNLALAVETPAGPERILVTAGARTVGDPDEVFFIASDIFKGPSPRQRPPYARVTREPAASFLEAAARDVRVTLTRHFVPYTTRGKGRLAEVVTTALFETSVGQRMLVDSRAGDYPHDGVPIMPLNLVVTFDDAAIAERLSSGRVLS